MRVERLGGQRMRGDAGERRKGEGRTWEKREKWEHYE